MTAADVLTALLGLLVVSMTLGALGYGAISLGRWARRTGRRPWLWLVGAYVAANIIWAILRPLTAQP